MPFPRHRQNCDALIKEEATFCPKCGSALQPQKPNFVSIAFGLTVSVVFGLSTLRDARE